MLQARNGYLDLPIGTVDYIYMYDGLGHGLYEEAPDFLGRVSEFCT